MTADQEARFRELVEDEIGQPVSAGARVAHMKAAEAARLIQVDLSAIPEARRAAVVTLIRQAVVIAGAPQGAVQSAG